MSKHTPTPWKMSEENIGRYDGGIYADAKHITDRIEIATVEGQGEQRQKANAQFIVKACNLHDELVGIIKELTSDIRSDCYDRKCEGCSWCKAKQLLTKAEATDVDS